MNKTCPLDLREDEMGKGLGKNATDAAMCRRLFYWLGVQTYRDEQIGAASWGGYKRNG